MPIHDWTRVDAGLFHAFHHDWITEIGRALNRGLLPSDYYALPEQFAGGFGPDVLTLQGQTSGNDQNGSSNGPSGGGVKLAAPKLKPTGETDMSLHRRKKKSIVVRHVSGDRVIAIVEIVSPGNKASRNPMNAFISKIVQLLDNGVHLLIVDLHPPGKNDPQGLHAEIWNAIAGTEYQPPSDKPFTLAAYEADVLVRSYVVQVGVSDLLPDMPLFLQPGLTVETPLETTYQAAFAGMPWRLQQQLTRP